MKTEYRVYNQGGMICVEPGVSTTGSSAFTVVEIKKLARRFVYDANGSRESKSMARDRIACWTKQDIVDGTATADVY